MSVNQERITCVEEAITNHRNKIEALENDNKRLEEHRILNNKTITKFLNDWTVRVKALENHDIFKIWTSMRKGGKTTLEAMLNNNRGFKSLRQQIAELKEQMQTTITPYNYSEIETSLNNNIDQIAELKERLNRHVQCMHGESGVMRHPVLYTNKKTKELLKASGSEKESLKDYIEFIRLQYKDLIKHEEVCKKEDCLKIKEMLCHILYFSDSRGEKEKNKIPDEIKPLYHKHHFPDEKLPEVKKSQFVADVGRFQDSLDARSKIPETKTGPAKDYIEKKSIFLGNLYYPCNIIDCPIKEALLSYEGNNYCIEHFIESIIYDTEERVRGEYILVEPKTEPEPLNEKAITEYNRGFENGYNYAEEKLIEDVFKDLDFLEGNGNADWNIKTKIRPKYQKMIE